jgi:hypothetical protein
MPFTLSHPALVLPLRRTALPFSALFIGAMTPDFNYFILEKTMDAHTIPGVFTFCLPLGLILYFVFHLVLKYPVIDLFTKRHAGFLTIHARHAKPGSIRQFPFLVLALCIGAFSHLFWDSFTHFNGWFVVHAHWMRHVLVSFGPLSITLYRTIQHISSVTGLTILYIAYRRAYINRPAQVPYEPILNNTLRKTLLFVFPVVIAAATIVFIYLTVKPVESYIMLRGLIYDIVGTASKCAGVLLFLYSLVWHLVKLLVTGIRQHKAVID